MSRRRVVTGVDARGRPRSTWADPDPADAPRYGHMEPAIAGTIERRLLTPDELAALRARDEAVQRARLPIAKPIDVAKPKATEATTNQSAGSLQPVERPAAVVTTDRPKAEAGPAPRQRKERYDTAGGAPIQRRARGTAGPKRHPWGCICQTHVGRPWDRSEHWTVAEVEYLDRFYGRHRDEVVARNLGRSVLGVRLKAKRLGLHKRTVAFTARAVAEIFGVDSTTVGKVWIRRGDLPARCVDVRERDGRVVHWLIEPQAVEQFIVGHPELVDVERMPESPYRDLAARDPWVSLPEVHRRTGRDPHAVARLILAGKLRGRQRGTHWYVPVAEVQRIRPLRDRDAIERSVRRREARIEMRRNRRKGVVPRARETPMPVLEERLSA